jgi:hypothetical protein
VSANGTRNALEQAGAGHAIEERSDDVSGLLLALIHISSVNASERLA